jgi:hypothetical protein
MLGCLFLRQVIDSVAKVVKTGSDIYVGCVVGILVVLAVAFSQIKSDTGRRKKFFAGPLGLLMILVLPILIAAFLGFLMGRTQGIVTFLTVLACLLAVKIVETGLWQRPVRM